MTDVKIEIFPPIEVPICEKIFWSNKTVTVLCMWGDDIGNILYHMGTVCCSRTWIYWKKHMLCTDRDKMYSYNTVRREKVEAEECIDIHGSLCRKLTLSV